MALAGLLGCSVPRLVALSGTGYYSVDSTAAAHTGMRQLIAHYQKGVDSQMSIAIGHSTATLTKQQPVSDLGNFLAHAQLSVAQKLDKDIEAGLINYGGIRVPSLHSGTITKGDVFELLPFDNRLVTIYVPGDTLVLLCDHMARLKGWPVSGISFEIHAGTARNILVQGLPLKQDKVYKLVMSDYIANGGDNCSFLRSLKRDAHTILLRDAIIDYIKDLAQQGKSVHAQLDNRIRYAQ